MHLNAENILLETLARKSPQRSTPHREYPLHFTQSAGIRGRVVQWQADGRGEARGMRRNPSVSEASEPTNRANTIVSAFSFSSALPLNSPAILSLPMDVTTLDGDRQLFSPGVKPTDSVQAFIYTKTPRGGQDKAISTSLQLASPAI